MMPSARFIAVYVEHIGKAEVVVGSLKVDENHKAVNFRQRSKIYSL